MKTLAFDSVLEDFSSEHDDDPDAMKKAKKRVNYGKYWCTPNNWKFMYGKIENDVSNFLFIDIYSRRLQGTLDDIYLGPLIIKTFAAHYNTLPSKMVPNYDV